MGLEFAALTLLGGFHLFHESANLDELLLELVVLLGVLEGLFLTVF